MDAAFSHSLTRIFAIINAGVVVNEVDVGAEGTLRGTDEMTPRNEAESTPHQEKTLKMLVSRIL